MGGRCIWGTVPIRRMRRRCAPQEGINAKPQAAISMQYYFFHLMSWPFLPADFDAKFDSAWVWLPNSLYDPVKGHDLYREYIDTLAYAETLGFDGICVNE